MAKIMGRVGRVEIDGVPLSISRWECEYPKQLYLFPLGVRMMEPDIEFESVNFGHGIEGVDFSGEWLSEQVKA